MPTYDKKVLMIFCVMYFCLAVLTYGMAVPSGLFVPCILVGAAMGRTVGQLLASWGWTSAKAGTYALVGAASMLGGVTRMTISLTIILVETTNDIQYLLPIMMVIMISKWVGDSMNISLYDLHVELKSIPFVESQPAAHHALLQAREVMVSPVVTLNERETVRTLLETLAKCKHNGFPVVHRRKRKHRGGSRNGVDGNESNNGVTMSTASFVGIILRSQIVVILKSMQQSKNNSSLDVDMLDIDAAADGGGDASATGLRVPRLSVSDFGTSVGRMPAGRSLSLRGACVCVLCGP